MAEALTAGVVIELAVVAALELPAAHFQSEFVAEQSLGIDHELVRIVHIASLAKFHGAVATPAVAEATNYAEKPANDGAAVDYQTTLARPAAIDLTVAPEANSVSTEPSSPETRRLIPAAESKQHSPQTPTWRWAVRESEIPRKYRVRYVR